MSDCFPYKRRLALSCCERASPSLAVSVRAESNDMPSGDVRDAFFGNSVVQIAPPTCLRNSDCPSSSLCTAASATARR
eukprot:2162102-Karenia_brevis.AAC.1